MCGKFTAMASWREVVEFSQPLTGKLKGDDGGDEEVTYGVARALPVIVWDREAGRRRIVPMRWGFPHPKDWRRPQPIHVRSETIDTTRAFAEAFATGQRGIVVFKTFNEGEEVVKPSGKTETV
jgi:putative SOS response-associated peptidase YedK